MFAELKTIIVAVFFSLLVGGFAGWRIESKIADAAALQSKVSSLQTQIKARDRAAEVDAAQQETDQQQINQLKQKIEDAEKHTGDAQCLGADDTDRLRNLWR